MKRHKTSSQQGQTSSPAPLGTTAKAFIDLGALKRNLERLAALGSSKGCQLMPVVKSDAYGHGIVKTARTLASSQIWGLAVFEMTEAELLRGAGVECPIFLLSGLLWQDPRHAVELDLTVGVVTKKELEILQAAASGFGRRIRVHLKIDTGMARYGLSPEDALETARQLDKWPNLIFEGLYSHMPLADQPDSPFTSRQIARFLDISRAMESAGMEIRWLHLANSAGMLQIRDGQFNLCRPGIALYGAGICAAKLGLEPVMSLESRICSIRRLPKGTPVSYGHTFTTERDSLVALVPAGYDNGYLRSLSNRGVVLIRGRRAKVLGRVCMKTILADVTDIPGACPGDRVVLLGSWQAADSLDARPGLETAGIGAEIGPDELAGLAGTIPYEIMCLFGRLNRRHYIRPGRR